MLYEVITEYPDLFRSAAHEAESVIKSGCRTLFSGEQESVITSYSIHYTKLYDNAFLARMFLKVDLSGIKQGLDCVLRQPAFLT